MLKLNDEQLEAVDKLDNGKVLCAKVGSGKTRTALAYYIKDCGGYVPINEKGGVDDMTDPRDLYVITTAKKRDSRDWQKEAAQAYIGEDPNNSISGVKITVDSWNNVSKYVDVYGAFFIFDEQRVVGSGSWVKSFLKIAKKNRWILLTATPGDTWMDYWALFVANGWYKNKTDFQSKHVVWARYVDFPKVQRYYDEGILLKHRRDLLVVMEDHRTTTRHHVVVECGYDREKYKYVMKYSRDPLNHYEFIENASAACQVLRKIVNADESRIVQLTKLIEEIPKCIVFYNYDYELEIIKDVCDRMMITHAEWNGHKHEELPNTEVWVYIVQYTAGAEAWNCTETDSIVFYSQTYSYKQYEQCCGRIDRMNTEFKDLYYFDLRSYAPIDLEIKRCLSMKQKFNANQFMQQQWADAK